MKKFAVRRTSVYPKSGSYIFFIGLFFSKIITR